MAYTTACKQTSANDGKLTLQHLPLECRGAVCTGFAFCNEPRRLEDMMMQQQCSCQGKKETRRTAWTMKGHKIEAEPLKAQKQPG